MERDEFIQWCRDVVVAMSMKRLGRPLTKEEEAQVLSSVDPDRGQVLYHEAGGLVLWRDPQTIVITPVLD